MSVRGVLLWSLFLSEFGAQILFRRLSIGTENLGISFNLFNGVSTFVLILLFGVLFLFFLRYAFLASFWGKIFVLGAGLNILARLFFGGVWDYLRLPLLRIWFNGADAMIVMGMIMLMYSIYEKKI